MKKKICSASKVVIGEAFNFKVVNNDFCSEARERPKGDFAGTLDWCESIEVEITIEEVLYPLSLEPGGNLIYRFGGGLFSVEKLYEDLSDNKGIFSLVQVEESGKTMHRPSYEWFLKTGLEHKEQVLEILKSCVR